MTIRISLALLVFILLTACSGDETAPIRSEEAIAPTANIVYMTPTPAPTLVPTVARLYPTATSTELAQSEPAALDAATCESALEAQYVAASDRCLAGPDGSFCSGGRSPLVEPDAEALSAPGAVAEAARIDSLHSLSLSRGAGGGLVWLRLNNELLLVAFLIGDLQMRNRTPANSDSPKWRSFTVVRRHADRL